MRARFVHLVYQALFVALLAAAVPIVQAARPVHIGKSDPPASTEAGYITGKVRVVDGDTIHLGDTRIRLEGIDAPEMSQTCGSGMFGTWPCGTAAKAALERMIGQQPVTCRSRGHDVYGRVLAQCFAGGVDLNGRMVREGFAWAFVKYSRTYVGEEAAARAERAGIWQGEAEPAWSYRHRRWETETAAAPQGCAIKGKITKNGYVYHTPWSPWYGNAKIDESKGERWFCSEAEAIAAGWRAAGARS